jgi:hypothetical protein
VPAVPVLVPLSMWALFGALARVMPPRRAYNAGFAAYWLLWCYGFPIWVVGPRRAAVLLLAGRHPSGSERVMLALPVAGAVATALVPEVGRIDRPVAAVMVSTATVNAVGEELLWRGLFLDRYPDDRVRGALWPLVGFSLWHLAPQSILPSHRGRWPFVVGAAVVGAVSAVTSARCGGLRPAMLAHIATDACGAQAALFRLGRRPGRPGPLARPEETGG